MIIIIRNYKKITPHLTNFDKFYSTYKSILIYWIYSPYKHEATIRKLDIHTKKLWYILHVSMSDRNYADLEEIKNKKKKKKLNRGLRTKIFLHSNHQYIDFSRITLKIFCVFLQWCFYSGILSEKCFFKIMNSVIDFQII